MRLSWKNAGLLRTSGYTPAAGDLIFLDDDASGTADRIAITVTSAGGQLITVEGDVNGAVAASQIAADDARIVGIGALPELAADTDEGATEVVLDSLRFDADGTAITPVEADSEPSDKQVVAKGDVRSDSENGVTISKYIDGTDTENVFDITLTVTTPQKVEEIINEPDMAVVVVMDISNSMKKTNMIDQNGNSISRYAAALNAAEAFIEKFSSSNELGVSKLGLVAFNSHAHEVFPLSVCTTEEQSNALIQLMRDTANTLTDKGVIDIQSAYGKSYDRYTNIEAGLRLGQDVLNTSNNSHKYIVLLTDGFPTTYWNEDSNKTTDLTKYIGYTPRSSKGTIGNDGVFHDGVRTIYVTGGTNYSDRGAVRAREAATEIKEAGTKIFSIGVDVGEYTIQSFIAGDVNSTTIECGAGTLNTGDVTVYKSNVNGPYTQELKNVRIYDYDFEIGAANSSDSYKIWLKGGLTDGVHFGIGSGEETLSSGKVISYYHDSTRPESLNAAFDNIFESIKILNEQDTQALWVTTDTLPIHTNPLMKEFEFIGFFENSNTDDATPTLLGTDVPLVGRDPETGVLVENTASIAEIDDKSGGKIDEIRWDLKNSVPKAVTSGGTTRFTYQLTYRVRLENENYQKPNTVVFADGAPYNSNANASLTYRILKSTTSEGKTTVTIVDPDPLVYPIPAVKGWLGELSFTKQDNYDRMVAGAEFHLMHDASCSTCRGDGKSAVVLDGTEERYTAGSDKDGIVTFANIPSGHTYLMTETKVPAGYASGNLTWKVNIAYDYVTVTPSDSSGWNKVVLNYTSYELPQTGGRGTAGYVLVGFTLLALPFTSVIRRRKGGRSASK